MSLLNCARPWLIRPQTGLMIRRIAARIRDLARATFGPLKPYIEAAAAILFFSAIMVLLLGTKTAIMLSRIHS